MSAFVGLSSLNGGGCPVVTRIALSAITRVMRDHPVRLRLIGVNKQLIDFQVMGITNKNRWKRYQKKGKQEV